MKLLVWEQTGFVLWYKRLEQGTFELPSVAQQTSLLDFLAEIGADD